MRHLVTGGSGFLGNLIARRLAARGEHVSILDLWKDPTIPPEIKFIQADVCDRNAVAEALKEIEIVHHNAALVPLTKSGNKFNQVNVEGSRIMAEEAGKASVKAFIHMSSSAIYGIPQKLPIDENTPAAPAEIYGRSKWAGECAVREAAQQKNMTLIVIRPRTIMAKGRLGIFQILFERIRTGRNVYVIGDGRNKIQFVHAHDLMDAYMLALDRGKSSTYNVGTDQFGTLRGGLENLIRKAHSPSRVVSLPVGLSIQALRFSDWIGINPLSPWHYLTYHKDYHFDVSSLLALGWKPRYSNDEMFQENYDWYLNEHGVRQASDYSPHRRSLSEKMISLLP